MTKKTNVRVSSSQSSVFDEWWKTHLQLGIWFQTMMASIKAYWRNPPFPCLQFLRRWYKLIESLRAESWHGWKKEMSRKNRPSVKLVRMLYMGWIVLYYCVHVSFLRMWNLLALWIMYCYYCLRWVIEGEILF